MVMKIQGSSGGAFARQQPFAKERERKGPPPGRQHAPGVHAFQRVSAPSEQYRAEVAGLNQAIQDTEAALAISAAALQGLGKAAGVLEQIESAVRSPESEPTGGESRSAMAPLLEELQRLAKCTTFGGLRLLDGSLGCSGVAAGDGLQFVSATEQTRSSPPQGYEVSLTAEPMRATLLGEVALTGKMIAGGLKMVLSEGGHRAALRTRPGQSPAQVAAALHGTLARAGLALTVECTNDGRLLVQHREFGSRPCFRAASSVAGVLSHPDGSVWHVDNGQDIAGTIHGEPARGEGLTLTGLAGNQATSGLTVRYTGLPFTGFNRRLPRKRPALLDPAVFAGRVIVAQQALTFRLSPDRKDWVIIRLEGIRPALLGRQVQPEGGLEWLRTYDSRAPGQVQLAEALIGQARGDLAEQQAGMTVLAAQRLPAILARLRVNAQNLDAARPPWTLDGSATGLVRALSLAIRGQGSGALEAQARPSHRSMLELLVEPAGPVPPQRLN